MVSAVFPVDVNGRWVGVVGIDFSVSQEISAIFLRSQRYAGEQHFLLDAQGNYIQAGPWQKILEAKFENFKPNLHNEPDLGKR